MSDWAITDPATAGDDTRWDDGGGFQPAADDFQPAAGDDIAGRDAANAHGGGGNRVCYNCGQEG